MLTQQQKIEKKTSGIKHTVFMCVLFSLLLFSQVLMAQTTGDYRSVATGNWDALAVWQRYNGVSWLTPTAPQGYPGQNTGTGVVTIQSGHTLTLNASPAHLLGSLVVEGSYTTTNNTRTITIAGDLTIAANASFNLSRSRITVNGATNVSGTLSDDNNDGWAVFVGTFTVNNNGNFSPTTSSAFTFRGGIVNNGTFNKTGTGLVTFDTNNQSISGSNPVTMNNQISVTSITLQNNLAELNLTRAVASQITGNGTFVQGENAIIYTIGTSFDISTFDCSTNTNTVVFNRNNTQTIPGIIFHNLILTNGNTKTLGAGVIVNNDFVLDNGTTFNPSTHNFTVNGNSIITGRINDNNAAGVSTFQNVNLSQGSMNGTATSVIVVNGELSVPTSNGTIGAGIVTVNGVTSIPPGRTLTLNNNTGVKTFAGSITNNGTWISTTITTASNLILQNGFVNNSVTNAAFGAATFNTNSQSLAGTGSFTFANPVIVSGAITLTNNSSHINGVTINGTLSGTEAGSTYANAANRVTYYQSTTAATQPMQTGAIDASAAGNTFHYSRNTTATVKPATYNHLIISGGNTKTSGGNVTVNGDFTHSAGTFNPSGFDFTVNGNSTVSATINDNNAAGTVNFENVNLSGGTITGSATGTVNINGNLSIATGNGTIGQVNLTVNGTTSISASRTLNLNNNTGVKTFAGAITNNGTWTSTTISTASNLVLQNGFTNNSATNAAIGAATFSANNQQLSGTGSFTFSQPVIISGAITLTNNTSHVNGVTFNNTLNGSEAGATYANAANRVTYYNANVAATQPMQTGAIDAAAIGNTFHYNRNTTATVKPATYHNLIISGGNTKTLGGNTIVNGDFTHSAGTFNPTSYSFTVSGNTIVSATISDNNAAGTLNFENVNLSGGTITGSATGTVNINGNLSIATGNGTIGQVNLTVNGTTSISASRTLNLNNNTGVKTFAGAITNNGTWTSTTISTASNLVLQNGFTNNSATNAAIGAATFSANNQQLSGTGSFTFSQPVVISGAITLTNNSSHVNGVTFNNTINGTVAGSTLANGAGSIIIYQPNAVTMPMATGTLDGSASGNTFRYNRNNAQTIKPATYANLSILNGNTKSLSGTTNVTGNLNIANATTLDVTASNYALSVGGNWSNAGTFAARNGTVTFSGSTSQTITPNTSGFYNVVFNNTAPGANAITLANDVTITNQCTMTDGVINTSGSKLILTNTTAANLSGFGNASYVSGNLRRYIANNTSTYAFPVGNNTNYYRADIKNNNLNGITYIDANYSNLDRHDDADMNVNDGVELTYISVASNMWTIDPNTTPSSGSYDIYLYTGNISGLSNNEFSVIKRPTGSPDATAWTTGGGTINGAGGDGRKVADGYALRMGLTSFSEFGIGSTQAGNPLPIQLVSFTAKLNRSGLVELTWVTATEVNNDFFSVERSIDGINFEEILQVKGAGNTNRTLSYKAVDGNPLTGVSYYKLKQTDYDGTFTYSNVVSVTNNGIATSVPANVNWTVFPNPAFAGGLMNVTADGATSKIKVAVYDATTGSIVAETISANEQAAVELNENLKSGIYIVNIHEGGNITSKRIIVQ